MRADRPHAVTSAGFWPNLWGSPKQITWATTIRRDMLPVWARSMKPDDYATLCAVRDSSWWIANKDCFSLMPKMPSTAQCGEPPAPKQRTEYRMDEGKTYQPRRGVPLPREITDEECPPTPVPPLRSGVVAAPTREDWDNATAEPPQRYGPVPGATPAPRRRLVDIMSEHEREKAAGNLGAFVNAVSGHDPLANALALALAAKLGDPALVAQAEAAVKRVEESLQAIKDILKGTPKPLPPGDEHFGDEK